MTVKPRKLAIAIASAALVTLAGCGGGGGGTTASSPTASTTSVPVTVVDGAISNATVCLDKNLNGVCDSGEPSGKTDAAGNVNLQVSTEDVGKYPILAVVGTDAVDADNGPVTIPFTMQAPADQTAVVSPLTTLVQTLIASSGVTSAEAEASIQAQTGLSVSLFEDFTKSSTTESQAAGTVARMVVVVTQQQSSTLSTTVGTTAIDGAVITQADLDQLIQNKLLEILPALLSALSDPTVLAATTPADKEAALLTLATALVADPSTGLTTDAVATLVAINNQTSPSATVVADTPAAGADLRVLNFTNLSNWSARVNVATLAQATPDASGFTRFVQRRYNSNSSTLAAWTTIGGNPARQSDLHFNGSAWVGCALNSENSNTPRDANGNALYNTCDNYNTGSSHRATFDIAGRTLLDVYNQIRAAGYANINISNASTVLGSETFPANSKLRYHVATDTTAAAAYYPGTGNYVTQYSAAVSAGGVASTQPSGVGCNSSEFSGNGTNSTTLESLISAMTGTPCVFGQGSFTYGGVTYTSPDTNDERWGNSTVSIGTVGSAPVGTGTAPGYYSGNTKLRVAFAGTGTNPVTYYSCKEQFKSGGTRNCTAIGTGSYTIATKGDARILTMTNPPPIAIGLGYQRVFVERGGKIYYGYQNNLGTFNSARLDLTATNALFTKLGLPAVDPDTPLALTKTSYAGEWAVVDNASPLESTVVRIFNNGTSNCTDTDAAQTPAAVRNYECAVNFTNLADGNFTLVDPVNPTATVNGTFNFLTGAASGTYSDGTSTGSFTGARR